MKKHFRQLLSLTLVAAMLLANNRIMVLAEESVLEKEQNFVMIENDNLEEILDSNTEGSEEASITEESVVQENEEQNVSINDTELIANFEDEQISTFENEDVDDYDNDYENKEILIWYDSDESFPFCYETEKRLPDGGRFYLKSTSGKIIGCSHYNSSVEFFEGEETGGRFTAFETMYIVGSPSYGVYNMHYSVDSIDYDLETEIMYCQRIDINSQIYSEAAIGTNVVFLYFSSNHIIDTSGLDILITDEDGNNLVESQNIYRDNSYSYICEIKLNKYVKKDDNYNIRLISNAPYIFLEQDFNKEISDISLKIVESQSFITTEIIDALQGKVLISVSDTYRNAEKYNLLARYYCNGTDGYLYEKNLFNGTVNFHNSNSLILQLEDNGYPINLAELSKDEKIYFEMYDGDELIEYRILEFSDDETDEDTSSFKLYKKNDKFYGKYISLTREMLEENDCNHFHIKVFSEDNSLIDLPMVIDSTKFYNDYSEDCKYVYEAEFDIPEEYISYDEEVYEYQLYHGEIIIGKTYSVEEEFISEPILEPYIFSRVAENVHERKSNYFGYLSAPYVIKNNVDQPFEHAVIQLLDSDENVILESDEIGYIPEGDFYEGVKYFYVGPENDCILKEGSYHYAIVCDENLLDISNEFYFSNLQGYTYNTDISPITSSFYGQWGEFFWSVDNGLPQDIFFGENAVIDFSLVDTYSGKKYKCDKVNFSGHCIYVHYEEEIPYGHYTYQYFDNYYSVNLLGENHCFNEEIDSVSFANGRLRVKFKNENPDGDWLLKLYDSANNLFANIDITEFIDGKYAIVSLPNSNGVYDQLYSKGIIYKNNCLNYIIDESVIGYTSSSDYYSNDARSSYLQIIDKETDEVAKYFISSKEITIKAEGNKNYSFRVSEDKNELDNLPFIHKSKSPLDYTLSEGPGEKTLYIEYKYLDGSIIDSEVRLYLMDDEFVPEIISLDYSIDNSNSNSDGTYKFTVKMVTNCKGYDSVVKFSSQNEKDEWDKREVCSDVMYDLLTYNGIDDNGNHVYSKTYEVHPNASNDFYYTYYDCLEGYLSGTTDKRFSDDSESVTDICMQNFSIPSCINKDICLTGIDSFVYTNDPNAIINGKARAFDIISIQYLNTDTDEVYKSETETDKSNNFQFVAPNLPDGIYDVSIKNDVGNSLSFELWINTESPIIKYFRMIEENGNYSLVWDSKEAYFELYYSLYKNGECILDEEYQTYEYIIEDYNPDDEYTLVATDWWGNKSEPYSICGKDNKEVFGPIALTASTSSLSAFLTWVPANNTDNIYKYIIFHDDDIVASVDASICSYKDYEIEYDFEKIRVYAMNKAGKLSSDCAELELTPVYPTFEEDGIGQLDECYYVESDEVINFWAIASKENNFDNLKMIFSSFIDGGEEEMIAEYKLTENDRKKSIDIDLSKQQVSDRYYCVSIVDRDDTEEHRIYQVSFINDTVAPDLSVSSLDSELYSGKISVDASASDLAMLDRIELYAGRTTEDFELVLSVENESDGDLLNNDIKNEEVNFEWDSSVIDWENAILKIVAYDRAGNSTEKIQSIKLDNVAPQLPTNCILKSDDSQINIIWDKNETDEDFKLYKVYRSIRTTSNFICISSQEETDYTDTIDSDIQGDIDYYYYVTAVDKLGNESNHSQIVKGKVVSDSEKPIIVSASPKNGEKVCKETVIKVSASDNKKLDSVLVSYIVSDKNGEFTENQEYTKLVEFDCADQNFKEKAFEYNWNLEDISAPKVKLCIVAQDSSKIKSDAYYIELNVKKYVLPSNPVLEVTSSNKSFVLAWDCIIDEELFDRFEVYRSVSDKNDFQLCEKLSAFTFTDNDIEYDCQYDYKVVLFDIYGSKAESNIVTIVANCPEAQELSNTISVAEFLYENINGNLNNLTISEDGKDVPVNKKWNTRSNFEVFKRALDDAKTVYDENPYDAEKLLVANKSLADAYEFFESSLLDGKLIPATSIVLNTDTWITLPKKSLTLKATLLEKGNNDKVVAYESSNPEVVKINAKGVMTSVGVGKAVITVTLLSGLKAECNVEVYEQASAIKLSSEDLRLQKGQSSSIKTTITPYGLNNKIIYTSSNSDVATVSAKGVIKAVSEGTCTITVGVENSDLKAECNVTVFNASGEITLSDTRINLAVNSVNGSNTAKLLASTTDTDYLAYSSSKPAVAIVDQFGNITALKRGTTDIIVKSISGKKVKCKVYVSQYANELVLNNKSVQIIKGKKTKLTATLNPSKSDDKVLWSSSDANVATVDKSGNIKAISNGECIIEAKTQLSGISKSCTVKVVDHATELVVNSSTHNLCEHKAISLKATSYPVGSKEVITWSSSDESVATVNSKGTVTGNTNGSAVIYATTAYGVVGSFEVKVVKPAKKVTLDKTSLSLGINNEDVISSYLLTTTVEGDATTDFVTFKSSNNKVATVSESGLVTAISKGSATITATTVSGKKTICKVVVKTYATDISLAKDALFIKKGKDAKTTAVAYAGDLKNNVVSDKKVKWVLVNSEDKKYVQLNEKTGVIKVIQMKQGKIEVKAIANDGGQASAIVKVFTTE